MKISQEQIKEMLIDNTSLFNNVYVVQQKFDILPKKEHLGASINFQDLTELRNEFLNELIDTIVDWVYNPEKYEELQKVISKKGKSSRAANSEIRRKAHQKFRKGSDKLLVQGQLGELLLFHFIQKYFEAVPLLRKMNITTSPNHERFGADAIHYKIENNKNFIILGEAKTYTSKYKFNDAFSNAVTSVLDTYEKHKEELNLYVHEDFLSTTLNEVAEMYLNNQLDNCEIHLVSVITYHETQTIERTSESEIRSQIQKIIEGRYSSYDNSKILLKENPILNRITYIIFPIWELEELAIRFQELI